MTTFQRYINEIIERPSTKDDRDRIRYRLVFDKSLSEADVEFLYRLTILVDAWYNAHSAQDRAQKRYNGRNAKPGKILDKH